MKTRYCFDIVGAVRSKDVSDVNTRMEFRVRSDTSINRIVNILCEHNNLDVNEVKTVVILSRTPKHTEIQYVPFDANQVITFRDMAVVGKKSIEVQVDLLVRW